MQPPAVPEQPGPPYGADGFDFFGAEAIDIGELRQGTEASRWALARYLVGRAIGESVSRSLLVLAVAVLALAGLVQWLGATFWAVVIVVLALGILAMRAVLGAVLRRVSAAAVYRPLEDRLRTLVRQTRRDVLGELRRAGLPGRTITLPWLAVRLLRRRTRADTVARLRRFRVDQVVTPARVDELHLVLRGAVGR